MLRLTSPAPPSFAAEVQVALTLRTVCALTTAQVARAFLAARTRWRSACCAPSQKIRSPAFPMRLGAGTRRAGAATGGVLAVIYLVFTEGYAATSAKIDAADLAREAIRRRGCSNALIPDAARSRVARPDCCCTITPRRPRDRGR